MSRLARGRWALLLVDFLNPLDFNRDRAFVARAVAAAQATLKLKQRMRRARRPIIYANDHWGEWTHNLDDLIERLVSSRLPGKRLVELLAPQPGEYAILKPRHSAFYGTPLEFLLDELKIDALAITGIAADNCVLFSAADAYVRKFKLWIPANCVASERDAHRLAALAHMQRVFKAHIAAA